MYIGKKKVESFIVGMIRRVIIQRSIETMLYVKDGNGSYESIYGERLKKINFWKKEDNLKLYESDVNEVTRFLN
jgi:hypothetical protein